MTRISWRIVLLVVFLFLLVLFINSNSLAEDSYGTDDSYDLVQFSLGWGEKYNDKVAYFFFADPRISLDVYNFYERDQNTIQIDTAFSIFAREPKLFERLQLGISITQDKRLEYKLIGKDYFDQGFLMARWNFPKATAKLYYPLAFQSNDKRWYPRFEIDSNFDFAQVRKWKIFISSNVIYDSNEGWDSCLGIKIQRGDFYFKIASNDNYFLCVGTTIKSFNY